MKLEIPKNLPDTAGVKVLLEILEQSNLDVTVSLGRVCGSRVAAVVLDDDLGIHSLTLEPFELENAVVARAKTLAFIEELCFEKV